MKLYHMVFAALAILISFGSGVSAQQTVGARMIAAISGNDIASNDVLFQFADLMDLSALESLTQSQGGQAVDFNILISHLPSPPAGWTAGEPQGMLVSTVAGSYSFASRDYNRDGAEDEVTVVIWDTANQQMGPWYAFWYGIISYETTEGYARSTIYKGYPAWETRTYEDESGALVIGVSTTSPIPEVGYVIWVAAGLAAVALGRRAV